MLMQEPIRISRRPANIMAGVAIVFVGLSGVSKLADLSEFHAQMLQWTTLPQPVASILAPFIPAIELSLAVAWLLGLGLRWVASSTLLLLVIFSLALWAEGAFGTAVGCACMGSVSTRLGLSDGIWFGLVRNLVLIGLLLPAVLPSRTATAHVSVRSSTPEPPRTGTPAFTLLEVLVSILIIGLLAGLTFRAISLVRTHARLSAAMAAVAQHGRVLSAYGVDHKDMFPLFLNPTEAPTSLHCSGMDQPTTALYFQASMFWGIALADGYYGGCGQGGQFRSPFAQPVAPGSNTALWNDYSYPCVFVAAPAFWDLQTREYPTAQFGGNRHSAVRFPSAKSLIVHDTLDGRDFAPAYCASFVDGHARSLANERTFPGVGNDGLPAWIGSYGGHTGGGGFPRLLHTEYGVNGRDLR